MLEQLQEQGWYLLPAGLERLQEGTNSANIDVKQAIKLALDVDLREIGGGAFGSLSSRGNKAETIEGKIVVQILKIRNISAPKANEESKVAPRLLKLTLTDGQTQYSALEGEHIPSLSLDTPPGTKLYLKNGPIKVSQGLLILNANCVSVLGGKVPALVEKWQLGRTMAKYAKGGRLQFSASGPPPWIPFGQKIQQNLPQDKNFKSLQSKEKDESKENAEFNALRNEAIAEATKLGTRKAFGGGAKQMVDANVQKIMDKGFTEDQAVHALKLTRNNVHRALSNLQRIEERKQTQNEMKTGSFEPPQKPGKRELRGKRDSESDLSSKPSAKVSLFDFLEDILPESEATNKKSVSKESTPNIGKENKPVTENNPNKQSSYNSYPNANANTRHSNSAPGQQQSNQFNPSSQYISSSKGYNQRFENNISSSFANRNSSTGSSTRNYNQQPPQQQSSYQQSNNASANYKSQDYHTSSRYRGPPNSSNGNEAPQRGRHDTKFGQSHSSYNPHPQHQTQQSQYRNDTYNNNPSSGGRSHKYDPNNASGKAQATNANYNYGHVDNRLSQGYTGQSESRKYSNGPSSHYHHQQQQQSSHSQTSYTSGGKQVQGYSVGNSNTSNHPNSQLNNHYGTTNSHAVDSNSMVNANSGKPKKGARYNSNKEEVSKFTSAPEHTVPSQGRKQPPPKGHQPSGNTQTNQAPSVSTSKQPSTSPAGNAGKIAQLTEATANLQISNKPFTNPNPQIMNTPKPHPSPLTGPVPPPPTTPTTPVVAKNFIQLPNGFNYNPYQIMGFQNKQTNEFALNVLKSQQFDAMQSAHLATQQPVAVPGVAMAPSAAVVPQVLAATPAGSVATPVHPSMQQTASTGLPNWKVGDRCLAKYWEDGGFYNAEITAISENTFVVCFLEYGNYEEVLKTDCIPVSQSTVPAPGHQQMHGPPPPAAMGFHPTANPHMAHPGPTMMQHPPPAGVYPGQGMDNQSGVHYGYKPQPSQYPHHALSHQQQQRPSKFREQRPMYVPPAQRK